jgi:hypothetical protein
MLENSRQYGELLTSCPGGNVEAAPQLTRPPCSDKVKVGPFEILGTWPASLALDATVMAARLYDIRRWTEDEDKLLQTMCDAGKSFPLIIAKLKRPMTSIRARAEDLHIRIPGTGMGTRGRR